MRSSVVCVLAAVADHQAQHRGKLALMVEIGPVYRRQRVAKVAHLIRNPAGTAAPAMKKIQKFMRSKGSPGPDWPPLKPLPDRRFNPRGETPR